jgi:anti-anti-sigma factor
MGAWPFTQPQERQPKAGNAMDLRHEHLVVADRCYLVLHGEIDLAVRDELRLALQDAIGRANLTEVDLRDVTLLDCAGIGVLMEAAANARRQRRVVVVSNAAGIVHRALALTDVLSRLSEPPVAIGATA